MYFEKINPIPYPFGDEFKVVRDITLNIRFRKEIISNITLYDEYDIENDDTPEIIAEKLYGDPNLYWILMLFNEKYHHIYDFPMSEDALQRYTEEKYGSDKTYAPHYLFGMPMYMNARGYIVDPDTPGATLITNIDYEMAENEKKRRIKVISPRLIDQIVREAEDLMTNG